MIHHFTKVLLLVWLFLPGSAIADITVLVHGYHGSGGSWRQTGIVFLLEQQGWKDAGYYDPVYGNMGYPGQTLENHEKQLVTAELPSEAPVEVQADFLNRYLMDIHSLYPDQKIHLVAHSAGGLVARLTLVKNPDLPVIQLITIATPHLGTPMAKIAKKAAESPASLIAPFVGADGLRRSKILYGQLSREKDNYFLFWLNRQPHPQITYTSIIRANGSIIDGDYLVPSYSQNMAAVPAIDKNTPFILTKGNHNLKYLDGFLLLELLP